MNKLLNNDFLVPRCMSTQHPDNASPPFFAKGSALTSEEEVQEAFYAYQTLGCEEQMWDHEGKEVDSYVVPKLLTKHGKFFHKRKLGRHLRLTLRVPNPSRERGSAKALLEILESIPRSYDVARHFYHQDIAPIFEVILPMTTHSIELSRIWSYYRKFVVGKAEQPVLSGDLKLKEWIGEFAPKDIHVIPLIEDKPSLLSADKIVGDYLKYKSVPYKRVFLARSDPAMTYGSASAVLLLKIALAKLHRLEKKLGIPVYPIVGLGSAPFRGHFKPTNLKSRLIGYPSVQTFTVQSAFKFDYPEELVRKAVSDIKNAGRKAPTPIQNEARLLNLIEKMSKTFSRQVEKMARLINELASYVPGRRTRRLHTGLFGYARAVANKRLPRAIGFTAALYSVGCPPELLGLSDLTSNDVKLIVDHYPNFLHDLNYAFSFYDPQCLNLVPKSVAVDLEKTIRLLRLEADPNMIHQVLVRAIRKRLDKTEQRTITDLMTQAARERKFLG